MPAPRELDPQNGSQSMLERGGKQVNDEGESELVSMDKRDEKATTSGKDQWSTCERERERTDIRTCTYSCLFLKN